MADDLDDAVFCLPSQFLTDDDILMDFKFDPSAFGFASTSDDDLLLSGLTPQFPGSDPELLGSPQSTLCGWEITQQGSGSGSVSTPNEPAKEVTDVATLYLLNKAAGEVAKMKLRSESQRSKGTGFFDCSKKGKRLFYPHQPPLSTSPIYPPQPQFRVFPPHMMWGPLQLQPPPQQPQMHNRVTVATTKTNKNSGNINNRTLGLPPSAWPPLPGQAQAQSEAPQPTEAQAQTSQPPAQPMIGLCPGPPHSISVGTGVFFPRRVTTTAAAKPKKKSEVYVVKTKNNKNSRKRNTRPSKAKNDEIQLPSEWVY